MAPLTVAEAATAPGVVAASEPVAARAGAMSPHELADLVRSFTQVTSKLEASHDRLRGEVLRLTAELSEANRQLERSRRLSALGEMAAGIAHEVRNPLGSIRLYAGILMKDLADPSRHLAVKIDSAARDLDGVVGDVLSFAREIRLRRERVDVAELFERVIESTRADGAAAGVRTVAEAGAGESVWADEALTRQALVNLVRNAQEAVSVLPESRRVVRLGVRSEPGTSGDGKGGPNHTVLRVEDRGEGVTDDVRARMFNPFFTTRAAGTGLGLSIVHRIVDAHGGVVSIRNIVGESGEVRGAAAEIGFPESDG